MHNNNNNSSNNNNNNNNLCVFMTYLICWLEQNVVTVVRTGCLTLPIISYLHHNTPTVEYIGLVRRKNEIQQFALKQSFFVVFRVREESLGFLVDCTYWHSQSNLYVTHHCPIP